MKYLWLAFFCAAPLWAETSAKDLQRDMNAIKQKAKETYPYQQVYALSAEIFADEELPQSLKIEFAETITLPTLELVLRHFNDTVRQMCTPEGLKLAKMNNEVVEKLKEAHALYLSGLKGDNPSLKARANVMAAVEAPSLAAQVEEYSKQLQEKFNVVY